MGFANLINKQVQGAFQILGTEAGELAQTQTYASVDTGASSYDTATGNYTISEILHTGIPMVLPKFSEGEIGGNPVEKSDLKALISALDLPVTPKVQDKIYLDNGVNYVVKRILGVPGDSLHILHIGVTE